MSWNRATSEKKDSYSFVVNHRLMIIMLCKFHSSTYLYFLAIKFCFVFFFLDWTVVGIHCPVHTVHATQAGRHCTLYKLEIQNDLLLSRQLLDPHLKIVTKKSEISPHAERRDLWDLCFLGHVKLLQVCSTNWFCLIDSSCDDGRLQHIKAK